MFPLKSQTEAKKILLSCQIYLFKFTILVFLVRRNLIIDLVGSCQEYTPKMPYLLHLPRIILSTDYLLYDLNRIFRPAD